MVKVATEALEEQVGRRVSVSRAVVPSDICVVPRCVYICTVFVLVLLDVLPATTPCT